MSIEVLIRSVTMTRTLAVLLTILCIGILLILFSSCDNAKQVPTPTTAEVPVSQDSMITVRILPKWEDQAQFAGLYVAKQKGFFARRGINADILTGGPDLLAMNTLLSGGTDFSVLFLATAIMNSSIDVPLVNIAQISQKSSLQLVARRDLGINSLTDLRYKRIGLWKDDYKELSQIFLQNHNLELEVVDLDSSINLFLNGYVEAMNVMRYNELHQIYQAGIDMQDLLLIPMSEQGLNIPEDGLYCKEEYYLRNPDLCREVADALMEGWLYAINNEDEAVDIVLNVMHSQNIPANRPHQRWMLGEMKEAILAKPGVFGSLERSSFEESRSIFRNNGYPVTNQTYEQFFPNAKR